MIPLVKTIPMLPMSNNQRERAHWGALKREKDDWTLMIPMCVEANRQRPTERRMVEVVFCKRRGPESDPDNLAARCKTILDALTRRHWIADDSPAHIDLVVREDTRAKRSQTVIAVTECADEQRPWKEVVYGEDAA